MDEYEYEADYIDSKTGQKVPIQRELPIPQKVEQAKHKSKSKEHHKKSFNFNRYGDSKAGHDLENNTIRRHSEGGRHSKSHALSHQKHAGKAHLQTHENHDHAEKLHLDSTDHHIGKAATHSSQPHLKIDHADHSKLHSSGAANKHHSLRQTDQMEPHKNAAKVTHKAVRVKSPESEIESEALHTHNLHGPDHHKEAFKTIYEDSFSETESKDVFEHSEPNQKQKLHKDTHGKQTMPERETKKKVSVQVFDDDSQTLPKQTHQKALHGHGHALSDSNTKKTIDNRNYESSQEIISKPKPKATGFSKTPINKSITNKNYGNFQGMHKLKPHNAPHAIPISERETKRTISEENLTGAVQTLKAAQDQISMDEGIIKDQTIYLKDQNLKVQIHQEVTYAQETNPSKLNPKARQMYDNNTYQEDIAEQTSQKCVPKKKKEPNLPHMMRNRSVTPKRKAKKMSKVGGIKKKLAPVQTALGVTNMTETDTSGFSSATESEVDTKKKQPVAKRGKSPKNWGGPDHLLDEKKIQGPKRGQGGDNETTVANLHGAGDCGKTFSTSSTNTTGSKLIVRGLRQFVQSRGNSRPPTWVKEFPCKSKYHPDNFIFDWTEGPQSVLRNTEKLNNCSQKGGRCDKCGIYSGDICTDCRKCNIDCLCPGKSSKSETKTPTLPSGSLLPDFMAQAFGPAWSQTQKVLENGELHSMFEKRNTDPKLVKRNCQVSDPSVMPMFGGCDELPENKETRPNYAGFNPMMPGMMPPYGAMGMPSPYGFYPSSQFPFAPPMAPPMGMGFPGVFPSYFMPAPPPMMPCYYPPQPMGQFGPPNPQ